MQLVLRRTLAVIVALGLPVLAGGSIVLGSASRDHEKYLVEAAPHRVATIVEIRQHFRGHTEYVVESNGNQFTLDQGGALNELDVKPGDTIEYVVDTVDPWFTVGVGDPEYWEPHPVSDAIFAVVLIGFSLFFAVAAYVWLLPAGFERAGRRSARSIKGKHAANEPTGERRGRTNSSPVITSESDRP